MAIIGFPFIGVAPLSISFDLDVTVFGDSDTEDSDEDGWSGGDWQTVTHGFGATTAEEYERVVSSND